jgi:hypothetical protein
MQKTLTLTHYGVEFTFEGNWEKGYRATLEQPGEPDGWDEYAIYIGNQEVTDVLKDSIVEDLLQQACDDLDAEENYPDYDEDY